MTQLGNSLKFGVLPQLDQAAVKRIKASVDDMTRNRNVNIRVNGAQLDAELKKYQLELAKLSGDKTVIIKAKADLASAKLAAAEMKAVTDKAGNDSGTSAGKKFGDSFTKSLTSFKGIANLGGNIAATGLKMGKTLGVNILKGAAIGLAVKGALTLTAALPAAFGATGVLAGAALGVGIVAAATKKLSAAKTQLSTLVQTIALQPKGATASQRVQEQQLKQTIATLQQFQALSDKAKQTWNKVQLAIFNAVKPLLGPLMGALNDVQKQLPKLQGLFTKTFSIVAPLIRPIEQMLFNIVANIMPGFNALLKATAPVFGQFANSIGKVVASNLGNFFKALAPAIKASMPVLSQVLKAVSGLLPIMAKVIATVATGLGPVLIKIFGAVWKAVRPLVGVIVSLATSLISDLAPVFKVIGTVVHTLAGPLLQVGKALGGLLLTAVKALAPAVVKLFGPLSQIVATVLRLAAAIIKALTPVIGPLVGLIGKLANMLASSLAGALKAVLPALVHLAVIIGNALVQAIKLVTPILVTLFNAGLSELVKLLPPIVKLIVQVAGVLLKSLMGALKTVLPIFLNLLKETIIPMIPALGKLVLAFIPLIQAMLPLIPVVTKLIVLFIQLFAKIDGLVYPILVKLLTNAIIPFVSYIIAHLAPAVTDMVKWFSQSLPHAFGVSLNHIVGWAKDVKNTLADAWGWIWGHVFKPVWDFLARYLLSPFQKAVNWIKSNFVNPVKSVFSHLIHDLGNIWNGIKRVIGTPINWVLTNVIDKADALFNHIPGVNLPTNMRLPGFARGGHVPGFGPGVDSVPAMLSPGEFVLTPEAASRIGVGNLLALNKSGRTGDMSGGAHLASGGFPNPINGIKNVINKVGRALGDKGNVTTQISNAAKGALGLAEGWLAKSAGFILSQIVKVIPFHGTLGNMVRGLANMLINAIKNIGNSAQASAGGPGSGPLGGATGSEMANGRELYQYLLANVFHGNKVAAAGATASIWGESTWNPFAQGTGGRGLIGWTPPSTISDAAFRGGMRTQLPAIVQFISRNGDWGRIGQVERAGSVSAAAWAWGRLIERFGIPDVHPTGIALATRFMNMGGKVFDRGGILQPGINTVYNLTGRPEHVVPTNGSGGNQVITLEVHAGNDGEYSNFLTKEIRRTVRVRGGGNVQKAFGRHG